MILFYFFFYRKSPLNGMLLTPSFAVPARCCEPSAGTGRAGGVQGVTGSPAPSGWCPGLVHTPLCTQKQDGMGSVPPACHLHGDI